MEQFSWTVILLAILPQVFLANSLTIRFASSGYRHWLSMAIAIIYIPLLIMMRRYLPLGSHTVISLVTVPLLIAIPLKQAYRRVLFWFVIIFSSVLVLEILTFLSIGRKLQELQNPWCWVLGAQPSNFVLLTLFIIILYNDWRRGKSLQSQ